MKLGLQLGYWGAQPPAGRRRAGRGGRGVRLRRDLHRRGVGLRRVHAAGLVGPRDLAAPARHLDRADVRPVADVDRHARADPRPPHRRPGGARHGRERPAGGRGLVRPAVRQAAGPHPRGRRHHPQGAGPRGAGDQRRPALPAALHAARARSVSASRSSRSCTRCAPTSRSGSAPRGPRTSPRPPRSPTAGSRSSTRPSPPGMYQPWLDEGFARPGARRTRADFEIAATCHLQVVAGRRGEGRRDRRDAPFVSLYMGGMGAKEQNFHKQVFDRMGYEDLAAEVQKLYLNGEKDARHRADPRRAGRRHAHHRHRLRGEGAGRRSGRRPA